MAEVGNFFGVLAEQLIIFAVQNAVDGIAGILSSIGRLQRQLNDAFLAISIIQDNGQIVQQVGIRNVLIMQQKLEFLIHLFLQLLQGIKVSRGIGFKDPPGQLAFLTEIPIIDLLGLGIPFVIVDGLFIRRNAVRIDEAGRFDLAGARYQGERIQRLTIDAVFIQRLLRFDTDGIEQGLVTHQINGQIVRHIILDMRQRRPLPCQHLDVHAVDLDLLPALLPMVKGVLQKKIAVIFVS